MGQPLRSNTRHTCGNYLRWPEDVRYELIDGQARLMAPSPTADHQDIAGEIYRQRAGVREYWLVHPSDRTLTRYTLEQGRYGIPDIAEFKGASRLAILPEVEIAWDALVARLPPPQP